MAVIINGDGIVQVDGSSTTQGRVRLYEDTDNGSNYVELQAAANVASNVTFTLPDADGTSGQVIQTNGSGALSFTTISGGGDYIMNVYSTPGTWTKPAGLKAIKVTVIGGGGGSAAGGGCNPFYSAAGAGGGTSIEYLDAPAIPGPQPYTVGTGGAGANPSGPTPSNYGGTGNTSSFGGPTAFLSATGGTGGGNASPVPSASAAGGVGSNGQLNIGGGYSNWTTNAFFGGGSTLGGNIIMVTSAPGFPTGIPGGPRGYGVGSWGVVSPSPNPNGLGVAGGNGVVIVEEFY